VSQKICHKRFLGIPHPPLKQKRSYQRGSKIEQVSRYRLTFMCWYWVLHKMFKVLTICRNTSVETSHHGFPEAFQLEHGCIDAPMLTREARTWISYRFVPCHPWCTHRTSLVSKKLFQFSCGCEQFHQGRSFGFLVINVCNHAEHYEMPCTL
jgi:hypothetical protein